MALLAIECCLLQRARYSALSMGKKIPSIAIGDADYSKHAGRGPSHGYRQHSQKILVISARVCGSGDILSDRQTDVGLLITVLRNRSRRRSKNLARPNSRR